LKRERTFADSEIFRRVPRWKLQGPIKGRAPGYVTQTSQPGPFCTNSEKGGKEREFATRRDWSEYGEEGETKEIAFVKRAKAGEQLETFLLG